MASIVQGYFHWDICDLLQFETPIVSMEWVKLGTSNLMHILIILK